MANETFLDASGATKYRKSTGAGTSGDPAVAHNILDSVTPGTGATNLGKAEDAAHASGDVGVLALVVRKDAPVPGGADGDYVALGVNSDGRLYVTTDGTVSITGSVAVTGPLTDAQLRATAVPVSLTSTTITGTVEDTQSGTWNVTNISGTVSLPTGASTEATLSTLNGKVTACNTGAVTISAALPAGSNNIGDVDILSIAAGSNVIGDVGLSGRTTGGLTLHSRISTGTDSTNVKASAGQVFWAFVTNTNASARYIKFYNSASAPTLGSGTPVLRFLIPPGSSGLQLTAEQGLAFSAGIGYTLSTGAADADTGAVAASEIVVNIGYR